MKITKMDKAAASRIGAELRAVLTKFAEERGLEYKPAGGKFDATMFRTKVEFLVSGGTENVANINAELYGYKVRFGDEVMCNRAPAKVVEITDKGKVVVLASNGMRYKMSKPELLVPVAKAAPQVA